jgi:two-component system cell cycle sensor histidine kinase/response regulator CckA
VLGDTGGKPAAGVADMSSGQAPGPQPDPNPARSDTAQNPDIFARIFEFAPDAMLLVNVGGSIIQVNLQAEKMFGYARDELIGQPVETLLPERLVGRHVDYRAAYMAAPRTRPMGTGIELVARRKDGAELPVDIMLNPLETEQGLLTLAVVRDLTEHRKLEEQFRHFQRRLQHVIASSPSVLYMLAVHGQELRPTWISENVHEMLGYDVAEVFEPNWWPERVHPEDLPRALDEIRDDLFAQSRLAQEYRFRHRDGGYRWLRSEMRLLRDPAGRPAEVVGSWSAITERKQLEDQFRQAQKMEAIGQLAGGVAHDFNNFLTIINGYSDLIQTQLEANSPVRDWVREIGQAGERAASLTRQLLAFSRKQVLEPKVLNLNAVVTDTAKMLQRLIGEDIDLNTVLVPGLGRIKADPGQIEQVLINLAVNARDAMPLGGKLTIETASIELDDTYARGRSDVRPGRYVALVVADTGSGMDEATKARIFEPFFTTKGPGKGTGLGLATVYGILKQSDGHIAVDSKPGTGTTFTMYLPVVEEVIASGKSHPGLNAPPRGKETILLAEDEPALRALARHVLEMQDYTVLEANQSEKALRIAEQHAGTIHLLLTDVVMPGMSGRLLAERVTAIRPGVKVLYLSGYTDDAVVRHGVLQAETAFLQKPFTPSSLAAKVREVLDQEAGAGPALP